MAEIEAMLRKCERLEEELPSAAEHKALRELNADMLAALKDALDVIETPVGQTPKNLLARHAAIRAAIAKAEGRAS